MLENYLKQILDAVLPNCVLWHIIDISRNTSRGSFGIVIMAQV